MAHEGQEILNPLTGQRMRFMELHEDLLRIESQHPPTDAREPLHIHPHQESGAEVLSGSLIFEVAGEQRRLGSGENITVPANAPHRFWNPSDEQAISIQFFRPALDIASFFETLFTLGQRGELTESGAPGLLQTAVMVPEFGDEIRLATPPWPVVRALCTVLRPIARRRGYAARLAAPAA